MTQDPLPPGARPTPAGPAGSPGPHGQGGQTNTNAILALVFGILSYFFLPLLGGILAVVFGSKAEKEIKADPSQEGATYANIGKVLGWINIVLSGLVLLGILLFFFIIGGLIAGSM